MKWERPRQQPAAEKGNIYIYWDSKLLATVVYFAKPDKTSLWAVWAEQHAQNTWFLPKTSQEGNNQMHHYIREAKSLVS